MPVGPVIANNTPLVALWGLGRLDLLRDLYNKILIPQAIYDEFLAIERTVRQKALADAPWITPVSLANPQRARLYIGLDQGEAEVLALAEERAARLVIIDELRGRRYAKRLDIPLTGTLGVLLLAKEKGLVDELAPLLRRLQEAGIFLDAALIEEALRLAGEA